ncbi:hypothetical protein [Flavobacterium sp. ABG]|uniref:hypothetical protein n=1 Tax=Flavobacterium sp. ABG TaxID=1423322 RepID=UPI000649D037|nr:hypothetical protein [Flavobacterium sp. ABG]KLT70702.1 hypothetical protein AB674_06145 [Flavobacterium sp. ABG]
MEFLNQKPNVTIFADSNNNNTDLMKELFESQSIGLAKIYEEINKNISINRIIEENEKCKRKHFIQKKYRK